MIVCICKAVSDRHIRSAVSEGATRMRDLTRELRVGTCCGKCLPEAQATLTACLTQCSAMRAADPRAARRDAGAAKRTDSGLPSFFAGTAPEFAV
jgi:bacterioferritin-associated ferredoxin